MGEYVSIHTLSVQLGLTSRTLRHWEAEGLFSSNRDGASQQRVYDDDAVMAIRTTQLLRQFGVPLKNIETVVKRRTAESLSEAMTSHIGVLETERKESLSAIQQLRRFLSLIGEENGGAITEDTLSRLLSRSHGEMPYEEEYIMRECTHAKYRIVALPPMRVVYHITVDVSPEDSAMRPVLEWLTACGLMGTARLFGGNIHPLPVKAGKPYGYGFCASIPEQIPLPSHLKEMALPGGLFARIESGDDIGASWKRLMGLIAADDTYASDRSRLCLEEHIRNGTPAGSGSEYSLDLLEPVRKR